MLFTSWVIAFCCVLIICFSFLGYGLLFFRVCRLKNFLVLEDYKDTWWALIIGIVLTVFLLIGIYLSYSPGVFSCLLLIGIFALYFYKDEAKNIHLCKIQGSDWVWLIFPLLYFGVRLFSAGLPQQHSDALYYHLAAPKEWVTLGSILSTARNPSFMQATFWEVIYGIPFLFFGSFSAFKNVTVQIYAQWMHVLFGQVGSTILAAILLRKVVKNLNIGPAIFLAWLCTHLPSFEWTGGLAKNEYILSLFALAAMIEVLNKRYFVAGIFAGLALAVKILALWFVLALFILIPIKFWKKYAFAVFIFFLPVMIKNYHTSLNPLFPQFDSLLTAYMKKSWLGTFLHFKRGYWVSNVWEAHNQSFGGMPKWNPEMFFWLKDQVFYKLLPKVILVLGFFSSCIFLFRSKLKKQHLQFLLFFLFQALSMVLMLRPGADGRYGNLFAIGISIFSIAALLNEVNNYSLLKGKIVFLLFPLGLLINIPVDLFYKVPNLYLFDSVEKYLIQYHPFYQTKKWMNENIEDKKSTVYATADKVNYYLNFEYVTVSEMHQLEKIANESGSFTQFLSVLKSWNERYVYVETQTHYPPFLRPYWDEVLKYKQYAIFQTLDTYVLDLNTIIFKK